MSLTDQITFVAAVNDREVLAQNLLASPALSGQHKHQILIQENFPSAAKAYNDALQKAENDLVVLIHQDMLLPAAWRSQLDRALRQLEETDPKWGVLGCFGAKANGEHVGHVFSSGLGVLGKPFEHPMPVQTLDEIVLIVRKSSGLRFDENLPHFHFYGTDICLRAAAEGRRSYVVSAFCIHNTSQLLRLPKEFYQGYAYIKRAWKDQLPIHTSCIRVSRFNSDLYQRRFKDIVRSVFGDHRRPAERVSDPKSILETLEFGKS